MDIKLANSRRWGLQK